MCNRADYIFIASQMKNKNFNSTKPLKSGLNILIEKRKKWNDWDFKLAHILIWISISAIFSSSVLIAAGQESIKMDKIWIVILAGITEIL